MKKILMTMALAAVGIFSVNAGTLVDFFNNNVRPAATMVMDAPADEIAAEGLKSVTTAMLSEEAINKLIPEIKFSEPVSLMLDSNVNGNDIKAWILPADADSEAFMFIKSPQANVAIIIVGDYNSVSKSMQE